MPIENSNLNRWVPRVNKVGPVRQQGGSCVNASSELGAQVAHVITKKVLTLSRMTSALPHIPNDAEP